MADIFISYSSNDRGLIEKLARDLSRHGYAVWWDTSLLAGENFRHVILRELAAALIEAADQADPDRAVPEAVAS